jgi:phytoene synthase
MDPALGEELRQRDRELWLATLYAPAPVRAALTALFALDCTLAAIPPSVSEPMVGAIRLAWWREALEALDHNPAPDEPHLIAARALLLPAGLSGADLAGLEARWAARLDAELTEAQSNDAEAQGGTHLFGLAARLLAADPEIAAALGRSWATGAELPHQIPRSLRPLLALAILGRRDAADTATGRPRAPRATAGRQLRMLMAIATGR